MMGMALGTNNGKVSEPESKVGERAAKYVEDYLKVHGGLDLHQLAWRLTADKRDLQRLIRERSIGLRLLEKLFAYFGDDCRDTVFPPRRISIREVELERERAEVAARNERLERERAAFREGRAASGPDLRRVGKGEAVSRLQSGG